MGLLELAAGLADIAVASWVMAGLTLDFMRSFGVDRDAPARRIARAIWAELRPFYLPASVLVVAWHVMTGEMIGWNSFFDACKFLNWFLFKDVDEDDRWKRRKAKLAEKIEQRGGRLVAVPVSGGS